MDVLKNISRRLTPVLLIGLFLGLLVYGLLVVLVQAQGCTNVITGPYNSLIQWGTAQPSHLQPLLPLDLFPEHTILESQYRAIQREILTYLQQYAPLTAHQSSALTFGSAFADAGWEVVMLRFYNKEFPQVQSHFPETLKLLPSRVRLAMFSVLRPYHHIGPHVGPFRGSMRYHLGIHIPQDRTRCFLNLHHQRYHWQEGKSLLFDDTYVHSVYNHTPEPRIVLFLDVQRTSPSLHPLVAWINHQVCHSSLIHTLSRLNDENERPRPLRKPS